MTEKKTFDPTKPVQTRDGRKVRILCTDLNNSVYPIVGAITGSGGQECPLCYRSDGKAYSNTETKRDLVNVPQHKFTNLYNGKIAAGISHGSLEKARGVAKQMSSENLDKWKGTIEETEDGEFVAFHPRPKEE